MNNYGNDYGIIIIVHEYGNDYELYLTTQVV